MLAYYCPQRQSQEAVAAWLEMRSPWAAKDYMTGMRNYSGMKVMQIIGKLREIDAKSKGLDNPNTPPGELMKELIFYILHWKHLHFWPLLLQNEHSGGVLFLGLTAWKIGDFSPIIPPQNSRKIKFSDRRREWFSIANFSRFQNFRIYY